MKTDTSETEPRIAAYTTMRFAGHPVLSHNMLGQGGDDPEALSNLGTLATKRGMGAITTENRASEGGAEMVVRAINPLGCSALGDVAEQTMSMEKWKAQTR